MTISNLIFKRETLDVVQGDKGKTVPLDVFTIENQEGEVVAVSDLTHPKGEAMIRYNDLVFIASPRSRTDGDEFVYITLDSLKKFIKC